MNKPLFLRLSACAVCLAIAACSSTERDLADYRKARMGEPLEFPDNISSQKIIDYYAIPPVQTGLVDETADVPTPPSLSLADEQNLVRIQSLGDDIWVLVQLVPGQVWPLIAEYAVSKGMGIAAESTVLGIIDTEWLLKPSDESLGEKYRFSVKQGLQSRSTEISLIQQQAKRGAGLDNSVWPKRSHDIDSAEATLRGLAEYLAQSADPTVAVSLRAQNIDTDSRLYLSVEQEPAIMMKIDTDRGLASVRYAIEKSGMVVNDYNIGQGLFYATPKVEPVDKKSGFKAALSKLAFFKKDKKSGWIDTQYVFQVSAADTADWLKLVVSSSDNKLDIAAKKAVLKEIKRNLT